MGISDHFKRNEIKRTLLDVLCLFWIPSSKYRKSKFHSKQMKHFASQIFLRSYPIFFSYALLSFFFGLLYLLKLSGTERTECRNFSALWKQRKQFFPLSTRRQISNIAGREYSAVPRQTWTFGIQFSRTTKSAFMVSSLLYPLIKASRSPWLSMKRETPSSVQTTAPQMPCDALCIHLCLSNWMDL